MSLSIVAINTFAPLVSFLRLDRKRGDGARFEPTERDPLTGLLATPVGAVVEPGQGGVDLGDQLALPVAGAQLDCPVGFGGGAVCGISMVLILALQMLQRLFRLFEDFVLPDEQLAAEILLLAFVHERLFVGWPIAIILVQQRYDAVLVLLQTHGTPQ